VANLTARVLRACIGRSRWRQLHGELENLHEIFNGLQVRHHGRHFTMFPVIWTVSKLVLLMKRSCLSPEDKPGAAEAVCLGCFEKPSFCRKNQQMMPRKKKKSWHVPELICQVAHTEVAGSQTAEREREFWGLGRPSKGVRVQLATSTNQAFRHRMCHFFR
jgi:hypothetical protein